LRLSYHLPKEQTLTAQLSEVQVSLLTDEVSVVLSIAVEIGMVGFNGEPVEVKYAGCGKVISCR